MFCKSERLGCSVLPFKTVNLLILQIIKLHLEHLTSLINVCSHIRELHSLSWKETPDNVGALKAMET